MVDAWSPHVWGALALIGLIGTLAYYTIWYRRVMNGARRDLDNRKEE